MAKVGQVVTIDERGEPRHTHIPSPCLVAYVQGCASVAEVVARCRQRLQGR